MKSSKSYDAPFCVSQNELESRTGTIWKLWSYTFKWYRCNFLTRFSCCKIYDSKNSDIRIIWHRWIYELTLSLVFGWLTFILSISEVTFLSRSAVTMIDFFVSKNTKNNWKVIFKKKKPLSLMRSFVVRIFSFLLVHFQLSHFWWRPCVPRIFPFINLLVSHKKSSTQIDCSVTHKSKFFATRLNVATFSTKKTAKQKSSTLLPWDKPDLSVQCLLLPDFCRIYPIRQIFCLIVLKCTWVMIYVSRFRKQYGYRCKEKTLSFSMM